MRKGEKEEPDKKKFWVYKLSEFTPDYVFPGRRSLPKRGSLRQIVIVLKVH